MKNRFAIVVAIMAAGCGASGSSDEQPRVVREGIEWLDVWMPDANAKGLPRVLLIGDSIARGYGKQVEQKLKGKAYVARLATSKSVGDPALLGEVALVLGQARFDVIHFNNGLHGFGYTEDEYRKAFPDLIATIKREAPGANLIWATTTPVRKADKLDQVDPRTGRVEARNAIAARIVEAEKIPVDDLFALMDGHAEFHALDGIHFNDKGVAAQAEQVAARIRGVLDEPRKPASTGDDPKAR
jgi:GDSL-like Lipase/Acylhydrolase family